MENKLKLILVLLLFLAFGRMVKAQRFMPTSVLSIWMHLSVWLRNGRWWRE